MALNMIKKFHHVTQTGEEMNVRENTYTMDGFAEELLKCIEGMPVCRVSQFL